MSDSPILSTGLSSTPQKSEVWSRSPRKTALLALLAGFAVVAFAAPLELDLPVRCALARDCFIQNYFDHDDTPAAHDYHCGYLTYDGHQGTDFRVRDLSAMQAGVPVIAAAPGVVLGTRDGEPDIPVSQRGRSTLQGKDAGNGVVIDHGDGWVTQYSHLRRGSVKVKTGQQVERGEVLGLIGESGNADFPHVDLMIRHDGKPVDPFAPDPGAKCGEPEHSLWSAVALSELKYQPSGLLIAGFASEIPTREKAEAGAYSGEHFSANSDHFVFWAEIFGVQKDDRWFVEIRGPGNGEFAVGEGAIDRNMAVFFPITGKKHSAVAWASGRYTARFKLVRRGEVVIEEVREAVLQ